MSQRKYDANSCIFVANIAESPKIEEDLRATFVPFGPIERVRIIADKSGAFYAFIQYNDPQHAKNALSHSQNLYLYGRSLRCEPAQTNTTLFMIGRQTSQEDIRIIFLPLWTDRENNDSTRQYDSVEQRLWFLSSTPLEGRNKGTH
ncbi:hypothetical protein P9112_003983 [Eukaryota sp. TZLM1-RC]